jgi:hypothetical protein
MTLPQHLKEAKLLDTKKTKNAEKLFFSLFGAAAPSVPIYVSKKKLYMQLGSTWIPKKPSLSIAPTIQVHPRLLKNHKSSTQPKGVAERLLLKLKLLFLPNYTLEEVITHEWVHCLRAQNFPKCSELNFEEILAYQTSSKSFRRLFGPLLSRPSDGWVLALSFLIFWIDALSLPFIGYNSTAYLGGKALIGGISYLFIKLTLCQLIFKKVLKKLKRASYPLGVMIKMSDKEIAKAALSKSRDLSTS